MRIIVAGAGIAGVCTAHQLAARGVEVVLVDPVPIGTGGASGAAAGLITPMIGRRSKPVWEMETALRYVHELMRSFPPPDLQTPIWRPVHDVASPEEFRNAAVTYPHLAAWHDVREGYDVPVLEVKGGMAVNVTLWLKSIASGSDNIEIEQARLRAWDPSLGGATLDYGRPDAPDERTVVGFNGCVICTGADTPALVEQLGLTPLHPYNTNRVKGQTIVVQKAGPHNGDVVSSAVYVVPQGETIVIGSTYEHGVNDPMPADFATTELVERGRQWLPWLRKEHVLSASAGFRFNILPDRLPAVGPWPGTKRTWGLIGLGSKGLMMAPYLASCLAEAITGHGVIPEDVDILRAF